MNTPITEAPPEKVALKQALVSSVVVYGHYPPPITGERLCCLHLIDRLRAMGVTVDACTKNDGLKTPGRADVGWLILGSEMPGFLRDCVFLLRQHRLRRIFVYVHNASWRRVLRFGRILRPLLRSRVTFVVLTDAIDAALKGDGWSSTVLRNTTTATELRGLKVDPTVRRLVWMAAITKEKGFDRAYAAFVALRSIEPGWVFDVYGAGLPTAEFPLARFHGTVQGESKRAAFAGGGLLLLPSAYRNETQPLCLLEAMAVGMPVVTSMIGGIPEIVGSGTHAAGECLLRCDPESLAGAIERVHRRADAHAAAALRRFERMFSPRAFDAGLHAITAGMA